MFKTKTALLLLSVFLTLFFVVPSPIFAQSSCNLPRALGRLENPSGEKLYTLKDGKDTYSYWQVSYVRGGEKLGFEAVIRQNSQGHCFVAHADPGGDSDTMTKGVPKNVAQAFARKLAEDAIKKKGKNAVQQSLDDLKPDDILYPEEKDAYLSLGLKVPPMIKTANYWTGPLQQNRYK